MITLFRPSRPKASGFRVVKGEAPPMVGFSRSLVDEHNVHLVLTDAELLCYFALGQYCDCVPSKEVQL